VPVPIEPLGLRERKKRKTRDDIVRAAMDLFLARGFDGTTVADIAEAADISPRTFFGYFPSKEDVVFHDSDELMASLVERIRGRAPSEDAFDALRAWIQAVDAGAGFEHEAERARRRLVRETPALSSRDRRNLAQVEDVLAEAVADDLGVDRHSLRPHLVSAAAVAGLDAISRLRDTEDHATRPADEVLDEALVFLQGGLDALRRLPVRSAETGDDL
jgi:AcrR family transcriptional regulator